MWSISKGLIKSKHDFIMLNPGLPFLFKLKWIKWIFLSKSLIKEIIYVKNGSKVFDVIGNIIGDVMVHSCCIRHCNNILTFSYRTSALFNPVLLRKGLGASRRTWITSLDKGLDGRIVKPLTIIYHEANKAGKHVDVHLGHLSMVYRISGKPVESKIKFNSKGYLTEESKKNLLNHIRAEIKQNARVPWNHDHTIANAKVSWPMTPELGKSEGYGIGPTRQLILEDKVEFYHPDVKSSLHMYAPAINPDQGLYVYQIYPGTDKTTPILIWGNLIPRDEKYEDRLHLKMIDPSNIKKFFSKVDKHTITEKIDGASCYLSSNTQGVKIFSPRYSKVTGHRIEYTYKLPEIANIQPSTSFLGMGELTFERNTLIPLPSFMKRLSAAQIGGILNSNQVRPRNITPKVWLYRMDKYNNQKIINLPFFENRKYQNLVSKESFHISVVPYTNINITKFLKMEGVVGIADNDSVINGYKLKHWGDELDFKITNTNLFITEKGNIAGTISATYNNKSYNFGASQLQGFDRSMDILDNPNKYIGSYIKVVGRLGGTARAAKVTEFHLDKGE